MLTTIILVAYALGIISAISALMSTRTSQGAIAWIVSLLTFPYLAVPLYWVFGRSKFRGYVVARKDQSTLSRIPGLSAERVEPFRRKFEEADGAVQAVELLADMPFLGGNEVELLIDGDQTFGSIFDGIERARRYVLVQFFIIKDDELGRDLRTRLIAKAKEGVRVLLLYDEIGSHRLGKAYLGPLQNAGVTVRAFQSTRGAGNRFQLNFRNHRKIVVVDGEEGWIGGLNVGDEYMGRDPKHGAWRDTHMRIAGPAALALQLSFVEDWSWATDEIPVLDWEPVPKSADIPVLILPSGPADERETASLMFQHAIHSAKQRVWIASPYFVPDEGVTGALRLAALRGLDVRILIPDNPDHLLVYYSAFAFVGDMLDEGIDIYRYREGFLHEKVFLLDDNVAGVGTCNLDNRSLRLNFEITSLVIDEGFAAEVEQMLTADFERARRMTKADLDQKPFWFRVVSRAAYLTAPVQ